MSLGLCFWILMLVSLFFGGYCCWKQGWPAVSGLLLWFLLLLLGWHSFGPPLHG